MIGMKKIIVVCDHGNASRMVAHYLSRALGEMGQEAQVNACGIFARIPTDEEIKESDAVIVAFDEEQLEIIKKQGFQADYIESWKRFCAKVRGMGVNVYCYQDYKTHSMVDPKRIAANIIRERRE